MAVEDVICRSGRDSGESSWPARHIRAFALSHVLARTPARTALTTRSRLLIPPLDACCPGGVLRLKIRLASA